MKSYLINLASRPDRLAQATEELKKIGWEAERFEAFTADQAGGNRMLAFNMSQYYCIKKAVEEGHERFAVFEDDVCFTDGAAHVIDKAIIDLDSVEIEDMPWGLLHLGCNIIGMSTTEWKMPLRIRNVDYIAGLFNAWQSHAVVWNTYAAVTFLTTFEYYTMQYAKEGLMIFDEWLRQYGYPCWPSFVMRPMVAYQRPDFSDLNQAHSDYTSCFELGNKYLMEL